MSKPGEVALTDEQLQLAWRHMRKQPHWPTTLELALAHPVIGVGIRGLARSLSRPQWPKKVAPARPSPPVPPTPAAPPRRAVPQLTFDSRKARLSKADRDDD